MKLISILLGCVVLAACQPPTLPRVTIVTTAGDIEVEINTLAAPITANNFLRYVDAGFYQGGTFYRTVTMDNQPDNDVRIEVIQGGANFDREADAFSPIVLERTNVTGIKHLDGVISMARGGPNTATQAIFICIGDQASLDFGGMRNLDGQGFGAFGRVIGGMDVVRRIQSGEARGQDLVVPVIIERVLRSN